MKKVIWIAIAFIFMASLAGADGNPTAINEYTYTFNNNTANPSQHTISTAIIRPDVDKITAYEVVPYPTDALACERLIAVYDSTTLAANQELIGEKEASTGSAGERFNRPRKINNAISFVQGAYTTAIISFIRE